MPDFGSQVYWDTRFSNDSRPFDWLVPASALCQLATDILDPETVRDAEILHIGCGTSDALALRALVRDPAQIHNVDYSPPAVEAGSARERESLRATDGELEAGEQEKHDSVQQQQQQQQQSAKLKTMHWSCMDVLALHSTLGLLHHRAAEHTLYDLVLDKSTSDSIACGVDRPVSLPYALSVNGWTRGLAAAGGPREPASVHPLHLLAVHLAALTRPGTGRWLCVSYSEDRFPFLPPFPASPAAGLLPDETLRAGFPHPLQLWQLERKQQIDLRDPPDETLAQRKHRLSRDGGIVMRPKISHWLYVLRRTDARVSD